MNPQSDRNRAPSNFLKDIFLAPHNFNDPENPDHGQYVNMQLRNDLYNEAVFKVFIKSKTIDFKFDVYQKPQRVYQS